MPYLRAIAREIPPTPMSSVNAKVITPPIVCAVFYTVQSFFLRAKRAEADTSKTDSVPSIECKA